ncbi:MAG: DUF1702 family protein [Phycisphaerales bacterium]|nr:MAG: DUF1702 family protein [Phycisphaerales bacterium]
MDWRRLGMQLRERDDQERVERICEAVSGGFNAMICGEGEDDWWSHCEQVERHYRPFAREGAALGYALRYPFAGGRLRFERRMVQRHPQGAYMYYVGAGFWHGMRNKRAGALERRAAAWDPMYRLLCYDGYGFKHGFFDYPRIHSVARGWASLQGYGKRAALQGVGRSLWFRFMRDPGQLVKEIRRFEEVLQGDVTAGLGLAAAFVHLDHLDPVWELAPEIPRSAKRDFSLGMAFAFRCRQMSDEGYYEECLLKLSAERQEAVRASLAECVRLEQQLRERREPNAYGAWREQLTRWMEKHVRYPLEGLSEERTEAA